MKKIFLVMLMVIVVINIPLMAEVIYLNDGQVMKGTIISQDTKVIKLKTTLDTISIPKSEVNKIDFSTNGIKSVDSSNSLKDRTGYEEFLYKKKKKAEVRKQRSKSFLAIGSGFGLPYGLFGYSFEFLIGKHFALGAGLDSIGLGMKSANAKIYFGDKGALFRWRIGFLMGDTHATIVETYGDDEIYLTQGKYLFTGFQWKMTPWLSLDFDIGYVMHDENEINYGYSSYWGSYSNTNTFSNGIFPALGLVFHI